MDKHAYWAYAFSATGTQRELLLGQLESLPTLGFIETDDELITYIEADKLEEDLVARLALLAGVHQVPYRREFVPGENWNAQWEASFKPIQIGGFVGIRAEFHPPFEQVEHELIIHPRMAFGTGHHATTYLVMERMQELDFRGQSVFDYGCGTGILAILARMLGAEPITAVDIEEAATENTLVNMEANQVAGIEVFTGDLNAVPETKSNIILANINRNVILSSLGALYARMTAGGDLLVSGILQQDQELVDQQAEKDGWQKVLTRTKDGWLLLHYRKEAEN
jgi:ribosomal protein L11 methyltransferase